MTTATFVAKSSTQSVNWNDSTIWSTGVVPNDASVDVVIPTTTSLFTGQLYSSTITVGGTFTINSLAISNNKLSIAASLTVEHAANLMAGAEIDLNHGSLCVGSLDIDGLGVFGVGNIDCSGVLLNETQLWGDFVVNTAFLTNAGTMIAGTGGLTVNAGGFTNAGALVASSGDLTVNADRGFANLASSTLSGGTYQAGFGTNTTSTHLYFNVGDVIATDAANIALDHGGMIYSGSSVPITSTMRLVAPAGVLSLANDTFNWSNLTVDGSVTLKNTTLTSTQLTVDAGGTLAGTGAINGPILNNGTIIAGALAPFNINDPDHVFSLTLTGPVTGSHAVEIAPAKPIVVPFGPGFQSMTLELGGAASPDVAFLDGRGILKLDAPASYFGTIAPADSGDAIVLAGISVNSVTGSSYSQTSTDGGVLTIQTTSGPFQLKFAGHWASADFLLSAGPQTLASDPPSLRVTVLDRVDGGAYTDFGGDHRADVLLHNLNGTVAMWQLNGGQVLSATTIGTVGTEWDVQSTGDFTGDGKADVLWRATDGRVMVWTMNGAQIQNAQIVGTVGNEWHVQGTGDLDGDGIADIVWRDDHGTLMLWKMNGVQIQSVQFFGNVGVEWHLVGIGDFNGDGKSDLLWRNGNTGAVLEFQMNGTQIQSAPTVGQLGREWHVEGVGDFNGDGLDDILWANDGGSGLLTLMNGGQIGGTAVITQRTVDWQVRGTGDLNGDGTDDIIWRNNDGTVQEWLMHKGEVATTPFITRLDDTWDLGVHHYDLV